LNRKRYNYEINGKLWKIQRNILEPKTDEVTGERRRLRGEKLHDLTSSQNYSCDEIENEMGGACSPYEGEKRCIHLLVGKLEGNRPFGRPRRWEDNIKMDLQDV
jgi:hypothetical protein